LLSSLKAVLSLDVSEVTKILDEISSVVGMPIGDQIPTANVLLEMGKQLADSELHLEEMSQELPFVKTVVDILKEVQIKDANIYVLAPKSFLAVKVKIPGLKEVAERIL